ncbi:MAG TPA: MarR family transcriptional regulator [Variovorax sp.]|jgi:DNA-binding MarR family transcriptional regulator
METNPPDAAHCAVRLRGAVTRLSRRLRPTPANGGVSVAKLSVVGLLYRAGALTPTEIAQREGVKLQSLTRLLAELEAQGWLLRHADAADGRRSLISLTRLGAKRLARAVRAGEASLAQVIADSLSAPERALLLQACTLIDGIAQALDEAAMPSAEPAR